jgi:hypothetical protein
MPPPSTTLEHLLSYKFLFNCKLLCRYKLPQKTRESLGWFRPENVTCLRPYEYWLHLLHTIKDLDACAKCPVLCNKTLSIKLVNYPSPFCKDHPDVPSHLPLQLIKLPFEQRWMLLCHLLAFVPLALFCGA